MTFGPNSRDMMRRSQMVATAPTPRTSNAGALLTMVIECSACGRVTAIWKAMTPPMESPTTCAGVAPRWSRTAMASLANSATLKGPLAFRRSRDFPLPRASMAMVR